MSWFQDNKYLSGLIGATVVGAGVLGYFTYDAMGRYEEANQKLESTTAEKHRLETQPVYPNAANLEKVQNQQKEHRGRIEALQATLNSMEVSQEELQPSGFQDLLRTTVTSFTAEAAKKHFLLPPKFYMGFDTYQSTPPKPDAATALARQLKAVEATLLVMAQNNVLELKSITRAPLPEEVGKPAGGNSKPETGKPGGKKAAPGSELISRYPFEVEFLCEQGAFQRTLDDLAKAKGVFLVVRNLQVRNEKLDPPVKAAPSEGTPADVVVPPGGEAPVAGAPGTPATPGITVIVGEERVSVNMLIEVLDFAAPPSAEEKKPAKKKK